MHITKLFKAIDNNSVDEVALILKNNIIDPSQRINSAITNSSVLGNIENH